MAKLKLPNTMSRGKIVKWHDATENKEKTGHAYYKDQVRVAAAGFIAITEVDEKGNDVVRHGKRVVKLVKQENVKQIGFVD
jgi:hypothetical protein